MSVHDTCVSHGFCHFRFAPTLKTMENVEFNAMVLNSLFKLLNVRTYDNSISKVLKGKI
jgi:hypothetical protein